MIHHVFDTAHQEDAVQDAVARLRQGEVIVYPTETCYGIGCLATNQAAVDKIFAIKERDTTKSLLVIAGSLDMMMDHVVWTPELERLSTRYWPGPLTVVADTMHTTDIARGVVSQDDHSIAFRISSHAFVHAVTTELGAPIVSTSANISGLPAPYESQDVLDMFAGAAYQPDAFFDVGALPHKSPSTIARVHAGEIEIIRQGELVIDR